MKKENIAGFEEFWSHYPKRVAKICALRAWNKIKNADLQEILAGISRWKQSIQWENIEYVPYPATFLNQERWKDEVPRSDVNVKRPEQSKAEQRTQRVADATKLVLGVDSGLGRHLRGELRKGTDRSDDSGLSDRLIGPKAGPTT